MYCHPFNYSNMSKNQNYDNAKTETPRRDGDHLKGRKTMSKNQTTTGENTMSKTTKKTTANPAPVFPDKIKGRDTAIQAIAASHAATEQMRKTSHAPAKKSPYTDHLAAWTDMTERNLHTEVRVKIATWCLDNATAEVEEFALLLADLEYIAAESADSITRELQEFRRELSDELIERIGRVFGREAALEIKGCL